MNYQNLKRFKVMPLELLAIQRFIKRLKMKIQLKLSRKKQDIRVRLISTI